LNVEIGVDHFNLSILNFSLGSFIAALPSIRIFLSVSSDLVENVKARHPKTYYFKRS